MFRILGGGGGGARFRILGGGGRRMGREGKEAHFSWL